MKGCTSVLFACLVVLLAPTALGWRWKCFKWPCYGGGYGGGYGMGYGGGFGMGYGGGFGMGYGGGYGIGYGGGYGMGYGGGYGMGYGGGYGMGYGGGWGGGNCKCRHRCWWGEIPMGRCPWCKWCKKKIWCCRRKKW